MAIHWDRVSEETNPFASSRHDGLPHRSLAFSPGNDKGRLALLDQEIKELGFWDYG